MTSEFKPDGILRDRRSIYRFALYGRTESGKTCLLATIAMGAIGHPGDLTCERLPVTVPKPKAVTNESASQSKAQCEAAALHEGKEWIDSAVQSLSNDSVPEGTPPDAVERIVDFRIGEPIRGSFVVRMIDYAGELINPDGEHDATGAGKKLKQCLAESDGFLILAEAPSSHKNQTGSETEHLRPLREAFASLSEQRDLLETPIAVAITKWDRISQVDFESPKAELRKLDEFIGGSVIYDSLINTISNSMTVQKGIGDDSELGLARGNCRVFPVTSFGSAEHRVLGKNGRSVEVPPAGKRRPYGVLEPLIWLANRRDNLDAANIRRSWDLIRRWSWLPIRPVAAWQVLSESRQCSKRIPSHTNAAKEVHHVLSASGKALLANVILVLLMLGMITDFLWEGVNTVQFHRYRNIIVAPHSTDEQLAEARNWFSNYELSWKGLFFSPSANEAESEVHRIDRLREEGLWSAVEKPIEFPEKAEAARRYLAALPNGIHASQCEQLVRQRDGELAVAQNESWLIRLRGEVRTAQGPDSLQSIHDRIRKGFPRPEWSTEKQRSECNVMEVQVTSKLAEVVAAMEWRQFLEAYNDQIESGDCLGASQLLSGYTRGGQEWDQLVREHPNTTERSIDRRVSKKLADKDFESARNDLNAALRGLKELEGNLRVKSPELAELQLIGMQKLQPLSIRVDDRQDEYLYELVRTRRSSAACTDYLNKAPRKTMADSVMRFRQYKEALDKPLTVTVSFKIRWDQNYDYGHDNLVKVWRDDALALAPADYVPDTPGALSGEIGRFQIAQKKLDEGVKIKAKIVESDTVFDDDAGEGEATVTIDELIRGRTLQLPPGDGAAFQNDAVFLVVEGVPQEPELPLWTAR